MIDLREIGTNKVPERSLSIAMIRTSPRVPRAQEPRLGLVFGLPQVPSTAIAQVTGHADNLTHAEDSRFREGRIRSERHTLIDKTRCTKDGRAPTTIDNNRGEHTRQSGCCLTIAVAYTRQKDSQFGLERVGHVAQ